MKALFAAFALLLFLVIVNTNCKRPATNHSVGVAFESLQSEGWVVGFQTIKSELVKNNLEPFEAIANSDANRQYEQVNTFITRGSGRHYHRSRGCTDCSADDQSGERSQRADRPYNRAPAPNDAKWVAVVNDNYKLTKSTVKSMAEVAVKSKGKYKAMILIGSLTDTNAVQRRDGFEDALKEYASTIEVVSRVSTEWNQEKALAGVTNALQAHSDINFIFCSSDFMLPSVESALKAAGKYKPVGEPGHAAAWQL